MTSDLSTNIDILETRIDALNFECRSLRIRLAAADDRVRPQRGGRSGLFLTIPRVQHWTTETPSSPESRNRNSDEFTKFSDANEPMDPDVIYGPYTRYPKQTVELVCVLTATHYVVSCSVGPDPRKL